MSIPKSERKIVYLISAIQFINVLEFMIVMPLGPDFTTALAIPASHLGYIGGSYTAAAAISGIAAAAFIERFDRRKALAGAMLGLICATLAASMAVDLTTLMLARVLAGTFGGPAMSLALAIIADTIPPIRRGKAMGIVMGAFSIASVFGIPAGLELARIGGWRLPFLAVAVLGIAIAGLALLWLPPMPSHFDRMATAASGGIVKMIKRPAVKLALAQTVVLAVSTFMLVPVIAPFVQFNLGYPRERLGLLYLCGGAVSFVTMRAIGKLTDIYGSAATGTLASILLVLVIYALFVSTHASGFVMILFALFMVANSGRNVACQTLNTKVPAPDERARFMSVQSSVQHMSGAFGAFLSSHLLSEGAGGTLAGMQTVAYTAGILCLFVPLCLKGLQTRLRLPEIGTQEALP